MCTPWNFFLLVSKKQFKHENHRILTQICFTNKATKNTHTNYTFKDNYFLGVYLNQPAIQILGCMLSQKYSHFFHNQHCSVEIFRKTIYTVAHLYNCFSKSWKISSGHRHNFFLFFLFLLATTICTLYTVQWTKL